MERKPRGRVPREHTPLTKALAEEVRAIREDDLKLTQQDAAVRAGMSMTVYQRIESSNRPPDFAQVEAIAHALGLATSELVRRAEQKVSPDGSPTGRGRVAFTGSKKRSPVVRLVADE